MKSGLSLLSIIGMESLFTSMTQFMFLIYSEEQIFIDADAAGRISYMYSTSFQRYTEATSAKYSAYDTGGIRVLNCSSLWKGGRMAEVKDKKKARKDKDGYVLRRGECVRCNGRYCFTYTDGFKKRHSVTAKTLYALRQKEEKIRKDMAYEIDYAHAANMTVNTLFDRYISLKYNLKPSTKAKYIGDYNRYVREDFGRKKIVDVKYSDIKMFYYHLWKDLNLSPSIVDNVHTLLHPAFKMAIRDQLLIRNPTDDVMAELKSSKDWKSKPRIALSIPQQKAFMDFLYTDKNYKGWYPIVATLIGTGMRISEILGLTWSDIDMKGRLISVNHTLEYRPRDESGKCVKYIEEPKTEAGTRLIPIFDEVKEALITEYQYQRCLGFCKEVICGRSGFVFCNNKHKTYSQTAVNKAIHGAVDAYNAKEKLAAAQEGREPLILPQFSAHNLRHTFCTRLCEVESNLKVIMDIMGHHDIQTTMEIYAESQKEKKQEVLSNLQGKFIIK